MLPYVETFITNAGKDLVVYAPDIPLALASYPDMISSAFHDTEPVGDEPRPGRISVTFAGSGDTRDIRFPPYAAAGHAVSSRAPAELRDDVEAWFLSK